MLVGDPVFRVRAQRDRCLGAREAWVQSGASRYGAPEEHGLLNEVSSRQPKSRVEIPPDSVRPAVLRGRVQKRLPLESPSTSRWKTLGAVCGQTDLQLYL